MFVVVSDDSKWCERELHGGVVYVMKTNSPAHDLASWLHVTIPLLTMAQFQFQFQFICLPFILLQFITLGFGIRRSTHPLSVISHLSQITIQY